MGPAVILWVAAALCAPIQLAAQNVPAGGAFVDSVAVEGNSRLTDEEILADLGIQPRTNVSFRDIQAGLKALWATGQFRNISLRALGGVGQPVLLTLDVEEHDIVTRVEILGLERLSAGSVRDTANLQPAQPYSPQEIAVAQDFIRSELAADGIPFASIEERVQPVPGRPGEVQLVLAVTEGQRVTIAQVEFLGNEHIDSDELRGALGTKAEGFWWFRPGSYEESALDDDLLARLPQFYRSRGYLDFRVFGDTLVIDPETGKTRLEVTVEEGPRYRLGDFLIEGNSRFPTEQLEQFFQIGGGGLLSSLGIGGDNETQHPVFDVVRFEGSAEAVAGLYRNNGYLTSSVEPFLEKSEPEGDADPVVNVGWRIQEGLPAYVNRIEVNGNDYTYERVVREQIFLLPGDIYSEELLIQSYQAVSGLGFFETPMDLPSIEVDPESGDVNITFRVRERQTGTVNFGTAMGGGTGLSGFLGYDQPNLFGQAKAGSVRWDFGRYSNNFTLTFTDPALLRSRVSGTLSLFNSRDRFFQFTSGQRRRIGASARFGLPVPGSLRTRLFVGYSISRTKFEQRSSVTDTSLFGRDPGTLSAVSISLQRQTLNHALFPTAGSRQSASVELNGGAFGGDGNFRKYGAEGTWYVPVGQLGGGSPGSTPIRTALGLSMRGGMIFGDAARFPFDQFWMGGVQFGERLRGYDETTITPAGFFDRGSGSGILEGERLGNAFMTLTAEYAIRFNDSMSLAFFYDAGNVWRSPGEIDPTRMFRGAGLGAQLVTPFGPLGLDYAYGFDKVNPGWQLHFRLGPGF